MNLKSMPPIVDFPPPSNYQKLVQRLNYYIDNIQRDLIEKAQINQHEKRFENFKTLILINLIDDNTDNNKLLGYISSNCESMQSLISNLSQEEISPMDVKKLENSTKRFLDTNIEFIKIYSKLKNDKNREYEIIKNKNHELNRKLLDFENRSTLSIYDQLTEKYRNSENTYRNYFYKGIIIVVIWTCLLFILKSKITESLNIGETDFWTFKVSLIIIGVTLISYFLKQSLHYQKLADQSQQTQAELSAYPDFMNSVPSEQAIDIRKELALKYFGKELDGSPHKDMSNLITDQMKSTTELVKATTEAIKNIKP